MKRYFYKDPLAAAWMAKHFGMRFDNFKEIIEGVDGDSTLLALPRFVNDCREVRRYFIHPDSLHLLEPLIEDMVTNIGMTGWKVTRIEGERVFCAYDYFGRKSEMSIIQRDGKPFMWPESEAA